MRERNSIASCYALTDGTVDITQWPTILLRPITTGYAQGRPGAASSAQAGEDGQEGGEQCALYVHRGSHGLLLKVDCAPPTLVAGMYTVSMVGGKDGIDVQGFRGGGSGLNAKHSGRVLGL
jgi:hypothetical protein